MLRRPPGSTRTDTLCPSTTLFRSGCYYNPLALGGVMGIPAGWKGTIVDRYSGAGLRVRAGTYQVTAKIATPYADALGLPESQRTETIDLVVRKRDEGDDCRGCRTTRATAPDVTPPTPAASEPPDDGAGSVDE